MAKLGDNERYALGHEASHKGDVAAAIFPKSVD